MQVEEPLMISSIPALFQVKLSRWVRRERLDENRIR